MPRLYAEQRRTFQVVSPTYDALLGEASRCRSRVYEKDVSY